MSVLATSNEVPVRHPSPEDPPASRPPDPGPTRRRWPIVIAVGLVAAAVVAGLVVIGSGDSTSGETSPVALSTVSAMLDPEVVLDTCAPSLRLRSTQLATIGVCATVIPTRHDTFPNE